MEIKTCRLLAQYNQTANQKMDGLIRTLTDAQWSVEWSSEMLDIGCGKE